MADSHEARLLAALAAEQERSRTALELLDQMSRSRTMKAFGMVHRLTRRGWDTARIAQVAATPAGPALPTDDERTAGIASDFHKLYYDLKARTWEDTWWMGHLVQKLPLDVWLYQELIVRDAVDVVVETGTLYGGSALYFASLFDLLGRGRVITIDVLERPGRPEHPRIEYVTASSGDESTIELVRGRLRPDERVMVVLDSDHTEAHVRRELELFPDLVTVGCPLVVEDTNINGHPVRPDFGPGPHEAVVDFLAHDARFVREPSAEKFLVTFHPDGVLARVA